MVGLNRKEEKGDQAPPENLMREGLATYPWNLVEREFGYEALIKYQLNIKNNEVYFKQFIEPISLNLLEAIVKDAKSYLEKK